VAEALDDLPLIARELDSSALSWCAARELTRVAAADTEGAWLDAARGKTIRQLEELVANRAPGDKPNAPPRNLLRPRVLRFEVAPETFVRRRASSPAPCRGRAPRPGEPRHPVFSASPRQPSRRTHHRTPARRSADVPAC
jgi:hypothetical protein